MRSQFMEYLISKGYKQTTPRGLPSTVYDYIKRIDRVCKWENKTWEQLADSVQIILSQYNVGGEKENLGKKSHCAVINAIKRFSEFLIEYDNSISQGTVV